MRFIYQTKKYPDGPLTLRIIPNVLGARCHVCRLIVGFIVGWVSCLYSGMIRTAEILLLYLITHETLRNV